MTCRVIFVEPRGVKANVFSRYIHLPLLGPVILGSQLHKAGMDVKIFNENILGQDISLSELDGDVLCLSALTPTIERAYELARRFKARNPRARVIIGGIHATFVPEEALKFADYVVTGEGESIIEDLIRYGSDEKIVSGERVADLDSTIQPDFSLVHQHQRIRITPIMTSRGCPYNCNFCSVTSMFGRKYRTVSIDRVMTELENSRTRWIFFYDDNFVVKNKRTDELMERMLASDRKFKWTAQVRTDLTKDPQLVEKMARAGCRWVYVGFESINPDTLKSLQKNQGREDIERSIAVFHRYGISVHGMFIFGSDQDKKEVFHSTVRFCNKLKIDSVQYLILTPFPGTATYTRMENENRLIHHMWPYYDTMHAVFQPRWMTASELQQGMFQSFENFYTITRLFNDSFNASLKLVMKIITWLLLKFNTKSKGRTFHFLLYIFARRIVSQWKVVNQEYFHYLIGLNSSSHSGQNQQTEMKSVL
ncbi:B12-binding domain-containing radical SAM protein [candidate division CSSED10-310 bacterium]|uniref:B12-binding domain-containing radical SAM protein n=1 Tax=candidate division CSSED10-310 bacterium TaxID=2855610 RepID=A0ABV6YY19_UNCC1